ncbi:hypothetical protein B0H11DRAFT_2194489 [Mycena galericulata]|nr:hypothetical protein B0H11DRAFT_2194489 [Mycena galericulata]
MDGFRDIGIEMYTSDEDPGSDLESEVDGNKVGSGSRCAASFCAKVRVAWGKVDPPNERARSPHSCNVARFDGSVGHLDLGRLEMMWHHDNFEKRESRIISRYTQGSRRCCRGDVPRYTYSVKFTLGGHDHGLGRDAGRPVFRSVIEPISGKRFASRWQPDTTYNPLPHEHARCISPSLLTNDAAAAVILVYPPQRFGNTLLHATGEPRVANGMNSRQRCSNLHTRIPVPVMGRKHTKLTYAARPSPHSQGARAPAPDLRSAAHVASDPKSHHHDGMARQSPTTRMLAQRSGDDADGTHSVTLGSRRYAARGRVRRRAPQRRVRGGATRAREHKKKMQGTRRMNIFSQESKISENNQYSGKNALRGCNPLGPKGIFDRHRSSINRELTSSLLKGFPYTVNPSDSLSW